MRSANSGTPRCLIAHPRGSGRGQRCKSGYYKERDYRWDKAELEPAIRKTFSEVQDTEREREQDSAQVQLRAAGFVDVERDDFDGLERVSGRVVERVTSDVERTHPRSSEFVYRFSYLRDGVQLLSGKSGEFDKLLAAVNAGVPA